MFGGLLFRSAKENREERADLRWPGRRESSPQAQGAEIHAGRLVRPGHDGADRLVGGGSDTARCSAWYLVGQTPSGQACLDAGAVGGRAHDWLFECVAL